MGSFDAGYGCMHMAHLVGQKKSREMWFLWKFYSAAEALQMGLVNAVFSPYKIDGQVDRLVQRMNMNSPVSLAVLRLKLTQMKMAM